VTLVVDRVATPLAVAEVERAVLDGVSFGSERASPVDRRLPIVAGAQVKVGLARLGDNETRMLYAVIGAGGEIVVARALLSPDDLAYNLGVLCEALASMEVTPLISRPVAVPLETRLYRVAGAPVGVLPVNTFVEPGVAAPTCQGLGEAPRTLAVSAAGDFSVRFVVTWWPLPAAAVRAACEVDGGAASRLVTLLGERYVHESRFVESGEGALRLELWAPERKAPFAADAFAAWVEAARGPR
jgi:hypothetical protein